MLKRRTAALAARWPRRRRRSYGQGFARSGRDSAVDELHTHGLAGIVDRSSAIAGRVGVCLARELHNGRRLTKSHAGGACDDWPDSGFGKAQGVAPNHPKEHPG
ncbi:hypothetical protein QF026_000313 [Streptomyces aurantiacus]|nr:hypothetical protein [Streptomyces aurantiacus]